MVAFLKLALFFAAAAAQAPQAPAPRLAPHALQCPRCAVSACATLSKVDVQEELGRTFSGGEQSSEEAGSICDYASGDGQVRLLVQHAAADVDLRTEVQALRASIPEASFRIAEGLGAPAFFVEIPGAGSQLYVIQDQRDILMVSVLGFGEPERASRAAAALARKALARTRP